MSIKFLARAGSAPEILIYDQIGASFFGDGVIAKEFVKDLEALGKVSEILVRINSPGGEVFDGFAIYNALKNHPAKVRVQVDGIAASIASVIAMAGDEIAMADGAMLMVHNPYTVATGDAASLRETAAALDKVATGMVDAYVTRTGADRKHVQKMVDAETWLTVDEAITEGFADSRLSEAAKSAHAFTASPIFASFKNRPGAIAMTPTEILAAETARRTEIRNVFGRFAAEHRELLDTCLDDTNTTADSASKKLLAKLGEEAEPIAGGANTGDYNPRILAGKDTGDFVAAASDALAMRAGVKIEKPHAAAKDVQRMSVLDIARASLSRRDSRSNFNGVRLIKAALSTSDFPSILENTVGKLMRNGFESANVSHNAWVQRGQLPDFKAQSRVLLGSAPGLKAVPEGGEYKTGSMDEDKTSVRLTKYGRGIELTWETLVNDDLRAFSVIPVAFGKAARRKEADVIYTDLLLANTATGPTMQDGTVLFHVDHSNIAAGGALSATTLSAARVLLRGQKTKATATEDQGYLDLTPRTMLVPKGMETAAEILLASATRLVNEAASGGNTTGTRADVPEFISRLQLVVEPRLPETAFYVIANSVDIDTLQLDYLDEENGPVVDQEAEIRNDTIFYKVRHVFGAKFIDWKGFVKVPST